MVQGRRSSTSGGNGDHREEQKKERRHGEPSRPRRHRRKGRHRERREGEDRTDGATGGSDQQHHRGGAVPGNLDQDRSKHKPGVSWARVECRRPAHSTHNGCPTAGTSERRLHLSVAKDDVKSVLEGMLETHATDEINEILAARPPLRVQEAVNEGQSGTVHGWVPPHAQDDAHNVTVSEAFHRGPAPSLDVGEGVGAHSQVSLAPLLETAAPEGTVNTEDDMAALQHLHVLLRALRQVAASAEAESFPLPRTPSDYHPPPCRLYPLVAAPFLSYPQLSSEAPD
jgi:hypothetical protein